MSSRPLSKAGPSDSPWRMVNRLLVALLLIGGVLAWGVPAAHAQGPVILMGIDAEDAFGTSGQHGPISVYGDVVLQGIYNKAFGGDGILVIGGGKGASQPCGALNDDVTQFWNALAADTGLSVTYVFGPAIATVSFSPHRMIAVVSDQFNTACGGLTATEHTTLTARQSDIANYVNSGRGLIGFSSDFGVAAYSYLTGVGMFTMLTNQSYSNITATPAGQAVGITDTNLDVCCWHDTYEVFPSFLVVLATVNAPALAIHGHAAAIGGEQVEIPVGITLDPAMDSNPAIPGNPHTVTATVKDQQGTPQPGVSVSFEVISGPNAGLNSTIVPTCAPGPSPTCPTDANGQVSWTYVSNGQAGTDTIEACFTDAQGVKHCAQATKEWVAPASLLGKMTGGGRIAGSTVSHGFHLLCDMSRGPQRLSVNWDKGNHFHLETLFTAFCSNDPTIDEENPPAGFDTYEGTGTGRCNNEPATISWKFTDAGEPGTNDTAKIDIVGLACSLSVSGNLDRGNHQALPE